MLSNTSQNPSGKARNVLTRRPQRAREET